MNKSLTIITVKGNLWLWGLGDCGQLGFGEDTYLSSRPALLKLAERKAKVLDVSCGDCHTCILTGILIIFGA